MSGIKPLQDQPAEQAREHAHGQEEVGAAGNLTLAINPWGDLDRTVYLVLDDFGGRFGCAWRDTDRAMLIRHLLEGRYSSPVRIGAFNITEGWSRDVSDDIAARSEIPQSIVDLIADYPSE